VRYANDYLVLFGRQPPDRSVEIAQFQRRRDVRRDWQLGGDIFDRDG
jgi:hypothetical protein